MPFKAKILGFCGVPLLVAFAGCAAAYRDYPGGCVPYGYCPPPPLAYTVYDACPTPIANCYTARSLTGIAPSVDSTDGKEPLRSVP